MEHESGKTIILIRELAKVLIIETKMFLYVAMAYFN